MASQAALELVDHLVGQVVGKGNVSTEKDKVRKLLLVAGSICTATFRSSYVTDAAGRRDLCHPPLCSQSEIRMSFRVFFDFLCIRWGMGGVH